MQLALYLMITINLQVNAKGFWIKCKKVISIYWRNNSDHQIYSDPLKNLGNYLCYLEIIKTEIKNNNISGKL